MDNAAKKQASKHNISLGLSDVSADVLDVRGQGRPIDSGSIKRAVKTDGGCLASV